MFYEKFQEDFNALSNKQKTIMVIMYILLIVPKVAKFAIEIVIILMSAIYTAVIGISVIIGILCLRITGNGKPLCVMLKNAAKRSAGKNSYCKPFMEFIGLFK